MGNIESMKPLLVFDLDGTLIDSGPDIVVALNKTLQDFGLNPLPAELIIAHISEGARNLIKDLLHQASRVISEEEITAAFLANYDQVMLQDTQVYEGVHDFLSAYEGPIGIITNKNIKPTKTIIQHLNLNKYPWVEVFGADSLAEKKTKSIAVADNDAFGRKKHHLNSNDRRWLARCSISKKCRCSICCHWIWVHTS